MSRRAIGTAAAVAALVLALGGCSPADDAAPSPPVSAGPSDCPSSAPADAGPGSRPAEPVDAGTPPPAPARVELRTGAVPGRVTVRVVAPPGARYESSELRVLVDGCRVPWTDEGDQLPEQTVDGLRHGDRVQVLARLNGEGGNSAETASAVLRVP